MIELIAEIIADLTENGISGAAGITLIVSTILAILIFSIIGAAFKKSCNSEEEQKNDR
jgi:hypothetical protein